NSGVYSAGNGPTMRSPILGVYYGDRPGLLAEFIRVSTRITHTDPKAERGALLIALAAHHAATTEGRTDPQHFRFLVDEWINLKVLDNETRLLTDKVLDNLDVSPEEFRTQVLKLDKGVTGYVEHT